MATYHHGALPRSVLDLCAQVVAAEGVDAVSVRDLAGRLGVSHTAVRHHFGSRAGVLTALAAQGFAELASELRRVREGGGSFLDSGVAYVRFARTRPAHFAVMFDGDVLLADDPALLAAQESSWSEIRAGVDSLSDPRAKGDMAAAVVAGWSMMHGLVTLDRVGALAGAHVRELAGESDLEDLARRVGSMLYGSPTRDG